jgi:hypothetical protein
MRLGRHASAKGGEHGFAHLDRVSGDRVWKHSGLCVGCSSNGIAKVVTMQEEGRMSNAISEAPRNLAAQFASDSADRMNARCNMRVGLWAGAKLGLSEESRAAYALEVMVAGMIDAGHDDVVDKIMHDLTKRGIPITRGQILVQLSKDHHFITTRFATTN